tara:strand:+ start:3679 stop:3945 length:267 start_codon:yes stop_codon:yes gene_type:complete
MWTSLAIFSIARGLDVHNWHTISPKEARQKFGEIPFWDYNETCVSGRTVKFSGQHVRFKEKEIRAWNTAILFAVENGIIPPFIGNDIC